MLTTVNSRRAAIRSLAMIALCTTLFSFIPEPGVDSFTIYLNDKLLIRQHVTPEASANTVTLKVSGAADVLKVHYNHCGKIGIKRRMAIQDGNKKVLKTWEYSDNDTPFMNVAAKELIPFKNHAGNQGLHLVYSSREIPGGMVLASLVVIDESKAGLK